MAFLPRKDEKEAVIKLLESEEYDSAEALSVAVLKQAFQLFQQRALYGLRWGVGGSTLAVGPFASEKDAQRFYEAHGSETESATARLYGPGLFTESERAAGKCQCGHIKALHEHVKGRGWCWALGGSFKQGNTCTCKSYVAKEE